MLEKHIPERKVFLFLCNEMEKVEINLKITMYI